MIIDIHVHPFYHETKILNEMQMAGVDRGVLLGVDVDPLDVDKPEIKKKLRKRYLTAGYGFHTLRFASIEDNIKHFYETLIDYYPELKTSNQEIGDLVRRNPNKFLGFGSVNPNKEEAYVQEKLEQISDLGLKGVKLLPTLQLFSPIETENFKRICDYCEKNKKVLLYHTGCDPGPWEIPELSEDANPKYLEPILEYYSPIIILAHFGSYSAYKPGIWFNEAIEIGKKFDNVYFDSSAVSSFVFRQKNLKRIKEEIGLDRLIYGSDYPVVWGSSMKYEVDVIKGCKLITEDEKENILGLNAANILNLAPY
ncbi:MAG: amidohydrolase [Candidatus Bathyarchaeota archaeon]|nr:MAG: amidohydrolase [Candidatus Bathyarchaeota archaeon]